MPIARHIFGRDKPSLTALAHGDGTPVERRRALGLRQLFSTSSHVRLACGRPDGARIG
ncbi:MAG: hypothetical protein WCD67_17695 [Xanthobacteraceae bacterium]